MHFQDCLADRQPICKPSPISGESPGLRTVEIELVVALPQEREGEAHATKATP